MWPDIVSFADLFSKAVSRRLNIIEIKLLSTAVSLLGTFPISALHSAANASMILISLGPSEIGRMSNDALRRPEHNFSDSSIVSNSDRIN